jgi:hypothetical protein
VREEGPNSLPNVVPLGRAVNGFRQVRVCLCSPLRRAADPTPHHPLRGLFSGPEPGQHEDV